MKKIVHILGIILAYAVSIGAIVVGIINKTPDVEGWKFIMLGAIFAVCATIALLDGARAFPTLGLWKAGAKFEGLSDLATFLIFILVLVGGLIASFA